MSNFVKGLKLSTRAINALLDSECVKNLEDFMALERKQVLRLPFAGPKTWTEISELQDQFRKEGGQVAQIGDGGPAFPRDWRYQGHNGMTLRDWFAGQWVAAGHHRNLMPDDAAWAAYEFADAMLAFRAEPKP